MASDRECDAAYSDELTAVNNQLSVVTLTSLPPPPSCDAQPLPTLPFDLIAEILCRLPVKLLLQLRCVCKFWNHFISHPKFAQKHLTMSTTRSLHFVGHVGPVSNKYVITSYPLHSFLTKEITPFTLFEYSATTFDSVHSVHDINYVIGSCNGILCIADHLRGLVILCNPSIRKFKELPLFEMPKSPIMNLMMKFGFGYDSFTNIYKVVVVLLYTNRYVKKTEVKVYTLGTDFWRSILDFPFGAFPIDYSGRFVSGRINWLASTTGYEQNPFIVSLDLANESYQQFLLPDYGEVDEDNFLTLHVLRDCLCIIFGHDVWIMNEYGNKESWTKLFTVSYMRDPSKSYVLTKAIYIFDDDHQLLLESIAHEHWGRKFIVYNSRNNTFNFTKFLLNENSFNLWSRAPEVCVESLILPWS